MIFKQEDLLTHTVDLDSNGGQGSLIQCQIVRNEEVPHGRCFAKITMEKGTAMPIHTHHQETEYYYVLQGEGVVTHDNGETKVQTGDVVRTGDGETHAIRNEMAQPLIFIALILSD